MRRGTFPGDAGETAMTAAMAPYRTPDGMSFPGGNYTMVTRV